MEVGRRGAFWGPEAVHQGSRVDGTGREGGRPSGTLWISGITVIPTVINTIASTSYEYTDTDKDDIYIPLGYSI